MCYEYKIKLLSKAKSPRKRIERYRKQRRTQNTYVFGLTHSIRYPCYHFRCCTGTGNSLHTVPFIIQTNLACLCSKSFSSFLQSLCGCAECDTVLFSTMGNLDASFATIGNRTKQLRLVTGGVTGNGKSALLNGLEWCLKKNQGRQETFKEGNTAEVTFRDRESSLSSTRRGLLPSNPCAPPAHRAHDHRSRRYNVLLRLSLRGSFCVGI